MIIIPAIDILDGKCVRLTQGKFDQSTVYADDPVEMARKWESLGAQRIHIVDLNGSRVGIPQETSVIASIAASVNVPVQVGGGVRTLETANSLIQAGVDRVIIGTSAALDNDLAKSIFTQLGDHAILGVDARDGKVAVKGWEQVTELDALDFARNMQNLGAKRVIYTDISRDGMLTGPNLPALRRMAEFLEIPVIASGGIGTLDDIRRVKELEPVGVEGVILGRALYTGSVSLSEALAI